MEAVERRSGKAECVGNRKVIIARMNLYNKKKRRETLRKGRKPLSKECGTQVRLFPYSAGAPLSYALHKGAATPNLQPHTSLFPPPTQPRGLEVMKEKHHPFHCLRYRSRKPLNKDSSTYVQPKSNLSMTHLRNVHLAQKLPHRKLLHKLAPQTRKPSLPQKGSRPRTRPSSQLEPRRSRESILLLGAVQ